MNFSVHFVYKNSFFNHSLMFSLSPLCLVKVHLNNKVGNFFESLVCENEKKNENIGHTLVFCLAPMIERKHRLVIVSDLCRCQFPGFAHKTENASVINYLHVGQRCKSAILVVKTHEYIRYTYCTLRLD